MNNTLSISKLIYIILFKKIYNIIKYFSEYLYIKITYNNIIFYIIFYTIFMIIYIIFYTYFIIFIISLFFI